MTIRRMSFVGAAIVGAVALFYIAAGGLVVHATEAMLVLVVAVLYGIFLRHTGLMIADRTPVSEKAGVGLSLLLQVLLAAAVIVLAWTQITEQVKSAKQNLGDAREFMREKLLDYPTIRSFVASEPGLTRLLDLNADDAPQDTGSSEGGGTNAAASSDGGAKGESVSAGDGESGDRSGVVSSLAGSASQTARKAVTATFGFLANILIVVFVGLYLALDPATYRRGFLKLLPQSARSDANDVFGQLDQTLWRWLIGRFATMLITGTGVGLTLWLIGVPMPITLGIVTGLLTFVPNIGPIIALALAVLVAAPKGMSTVGMTVVGYVAFQLIESYILTPMIQKRQIAMPPAVILVAQLLMGVVAGFIGIAVATPLVAMAMVVVGVLYVEKYHDEERSVDEVPGLDGGGVNRLQERLEPSAS